MNTVVKQNKFIDISYKVENCKKHFAKQYQTITMIQTLQYIWIDKP